MFELFSKMENFGWLAREIFCSYNTEIHLKVFL